eukprot:c23557_g2_i1 orf=597-3395(-)
MHRSSLTFLGHDIPAKEDAMGSVEWAWKGLLRGLLWRLKLGVLPSSSPCIEELRRAVADGRRKYAELRRRLLVDPHHMEGPHKSQPLNMDNPLSQDPDSVWSRYFQISELEQTIDNDLTRLYPEHSGFFQSPVCKAMFQRILLVWSLLHPNCSYRQGMHELLAPLLYVLHCDVVHLAEVKQRYENLFNDRFEEPFGLELRTHENGGKQRDKGPPCSKTVTTYGNSCSHVNLGSVERTTGQKCEGFQVDEWNDTLRILVLGTDMYGAEGELGVLLSGRFVEHDAFLMFNALMCGKGGGLNMADYFLAFKGAASTGLSPALEASALLYKALATADLPLYSHLTGFGVEPQFFALRWIRVLFGREFDLQTLLILWDALFTIAAGTHDSNRPSEENLIGSSNSPRKDFILALALSMLLYLRMTLLAAPNATSCLQKLLNFPQTVGIDVLIESARILSPFVKETASNSAKVENSAADAIETGMARKSARKSSFQAQTPKYSPEILQKSFPDFYWEEKWKNSVLRNDTQRCYEKMVGTRQGDSESNHGSAFVNGINYLLGSGKDLPKHIANGEKIHVMAVKVNGHELPFETPGPAGSKSIRGALQDNAATPQYTGRCEQSLPVACSATKEDQKGIAKVQQNRLLVADNSNQGNLISSRLELIDDSNSATTATPTLVRNFSKTGASYESMEGNVPAIHGSPQTGCNEGTVGLSECTTTDKGPECLSSTDPVDAVPSSASPSKARRKYWMWNFGKSRGQDRRTDKKDTSHPESSKDKIKVAAVNANVSGDKMDLLGDERPVSRNKELNLINNHADEPCSVSSLIVSGEKDELSVVDCLSEAGNTDSVLSTTGVVHAGEEASHLTDLGTLGRVMAENLHVIETVLARIFTFGTEDGLCENAEVCKGKLFNPHEAGSSRAVPKTVHVAVEDLKKISNKLQQM